MSGHELRHLAFVDGSPPRAGGSVGDAVRESCGQAALAAREAFSLVPGLRAFSWLAPPVERLLERSTGPETDRACADGASALAAIAEQLGTSLRLCGRGIDRPAGARGPAVKPDEKTLLWFRRYGGRDEILRAAARFFAAHPGGRLADDALDAWLDTAGVPDPDLLLYAGGSQELHDVLLWQGSYAEIWHAGEPGADFPVGVLRLAVEDFRKRQRRFGR